MRVLVFGKAGQLARSLADAVPSWLELELQFVGRPEVDLLKPGAVAALIHGSGPDLVINTAAYTQVDEAESEPDVAFRVNAQAAGEVAGAACDVGAGLIHVSTDYVFDGTADRPYAEEDATNPLNVYGASKLAGEEAIRRANPNHLIVRTSWLVSPYGRNFLKTMLRLAESREDLRIVDDQIGRPTVVADLANALLEIASRWQSVERGTIHLAGSGLPGSWADLAEHAFSHLDRRPAVARIATSDYPTPARRPLHAILDCGKAHRLFGIELADWRHSIAALTRDLVARSV